MIDSMEIFDIYLVNFVNYLHRFLSLDNVEEGADAVSSSR